MRLVKHLRDGNGALIITGQQGRLEIQTALPKLSKDDAKWKDINLRQLLPQASDVGCDDTIMQ